ncbi:MAG: UDP-3-O-(3-hydroxymyristoyl)glucosamine N-acyltransferase [Gemmatimonadaceae bacterium]
MTAATPTPSVVGGERAQQEPYTADDLASAVGGRVIGNGSAAVRGIAPLDRAEADDLSFLAKPRYIPLFERTRAGVVLISPELVEDSLPGPTLIVVDRPHDALVALLPRFFAPVPFEPGVAASAELGRGVRLGRDVEIGPCAIVGDGARLGDRVRIGAHVVVGAGVAIGDESRIFPGVTLYAGTTLGSRVTLHAGVRAGSDGFGYVFRDGVHEKILHVGRCVIGDDVEVGANSTIDRGSIDDTVIGAGTRIDNLVHIAHNVRVGRNCLILAQAGIAGSARIEDGCVIAGQAGLAGHVRIGRGARVGAQAGVFGDVPAGESWSGYPARPHRESLRAHAALFRIAPLIKRLERLLARDGS